MFDDITPESIKADIMAKANTKLSTAEGSFLNTVISAVAYRYWQIYQDMRIMYDTMLMETNDAEFVVKRCEEEGIERQPGAKARGYVQFTGADGTVIPAGTRVETPSGIRFITVDNVIIDGGTAKAAAECEEIGADGNAAANSIVYLSHGISGISAVTNAEEFTGGADIESIDSLKERYLYLRQHPAASGNESDYRNWAREVDGVEDIDIVKKWNGPGTVKVFIFGAGRTPLSDTTAAEVKSNIDEKNAVCADVTVVSATVTEVNVSATVIHSDAYSIDDITAEIENNIKAMFAGLKKNDVIYLNKILSCIINAAGVVDYKNAVCSLASPYTVAPGEILKLKNLSISEGTS